MFGGTYDDCGGTGTEMGRHAGVGEVGGKMNIGSCFRHVRVLSGEENSALTAIEIGSPWTLGLSYLMAQSMLVAPRLFEIARRHPEQLVAGCGGPILLSLCGGKPVLRLAIYQLKKRLPAYEFRCPSQLV